MLIVIIFKFLLIRMILNKIKIILFDFNHMVKVFKKNLYLKYEVDN